MRILFLNPNGTIGGAESSLLQLLARLRTAEPDWALALITGAEGPILPRAEGLGVSARVVPFPTAIARLGDGGSLKNLISGGLHTPGYIKRLRQAVRDFRPQVIHSNGMKMHLLSTYVSGVDVPVIWHVHDYVGSRPVTAPLLRLCATRCTAAVTNSSSVAEDLRLAGMSKLKIEAVHNGIDTDIFAPTGTRLDLDELAHLPPLDGKVVRVGFLGTFAHWKGHEVFLRALARVSPAISVRGYIIGAPIYQTDGSQHSVDKLKNMARSLGISANVGFTGFIDDPAAAIRSLDIVVHASTKREPFGMVIVEAMACGKAVIASNGGGASEIVQDHVNALTHEPGDDRALAARIHELATSPSLRARLGEAGRRTAEQRFNSTRFATDFANLYRRLAGTWN
jgi:glycosyltransferase involved in cell wall biosynthesis